MGLLGVAVIFSYVGRSCKLSRKDTEAISGKNVSQLFTNSCWEIEREKIVTPNRKKKLTANLSASENKVFGVEEIYDGQMRQRWV